MQLEDAGTTGVYGIVVIAPSDSGGWVYVTTKEIFSTRKIRYHIELTLAVGGVDTRGVLVVAQAGFEGTILSIVGCVVSTTNTVENVLAEISSTRPCGVANLEAESITTHEANSDSD